VFDDETKAGNPFDRVRITAFDPAGFKLEPRKDTMDAKARIRCPHCQWQPTKASRWHCLSMGQPENYAHGCGNSWNTFDTRGRCPGCSHQWRHTTCHKCEQTSLHDDWYEKKTAAKRE
jgi:hypothetical protein